MSSKPTIRVFISSPGDVRPERLVAEQVVGKLAREFAYHMRLEAVLWERQPLTADAHFQDNIIPPRQTDIVVVILWSRLGVMLPEARYRGAITGEPVTGTTWEFEDALAGHRERALPDLLMYRKTAEVQVSLGDRDALEQRLAEQDQITAFVERWFKAGDGQSFSAAFREFAEEAEFQELLEEHLRELLRQHVDATESATEGIRWHQGSPYRGLESFDLSHAPVFFGRTRARNEVRGLLRRRIARGSAFVLVMGASGSGKSSLVKAGLLHDLRLPGMIGRVALLRHAVITPADGGGDPMRGLAEACFGDEALPELAELNYTVDRLAELFGQSGDQIDLPFVQALDRAAEAGRLTDRGEARFLLIVDQLEELFTLQSITPEARERFVERLAALARSDLVWVVATMRSDFFDRLEKLAPLAALSEGEARYLLAPPSEGEIGQIIRQPAREAGLRFDYDEARGERLDEVLREAAGRNPGALPLLEFLLDQLWRQRRDDGLLTFSAFHDLGGLEGAIGHRAEMVLNGQPAEVQAAFPDLLRRLVTVRADDQATATARSVPLSQFADGSAARWLLEAFLAPEARLLVAEGGEGDEARVRVAHEALLTHWPRARQAIEADRADIEIRNRLEQAAALWQDRGEDESLLLSAGLPLSEAQNLLDRRPDDLPPSTQRFVIVSLQRQRQNERRRTRIFGAVAAVLALFAVAAGFAAWFAFGEQKAARESEARARLQADLSRIEAGNSRAALFQSEGRLVEAEAVYAKTGREAERLGAPGRRLEAVIQIRLASLYSEMGAPARVKEALQKALEILRAADLEDSIETARALTALAGYRATYEPSGDVVRAYLQAERILERLFGPDHPELIEVQRRRADHLVAQGDVPAALTLLDTLLARYRATLGTRHPKYRVLLRQTLDAALTSRDVERERVDALLTGYLDRQGDAFEPIPDLDGLTEAVWRSDVGRALDADLLLRIAQLRERQRKDGTIGQIAAFQSENADDLRASLSAEREARAVLARLLRRGHDPWLINATSETSAEIARRAAEIEPRYTAQLRRVRTLQTARATAHPHYLADLAVRATSLSALQSRLGAGDVLAVYLRLPKRYAVLAIRSDRVESRTVAVSASEIDRWVKAVRRGLEVEGIATVEQLPKFDERSAHRLFQALVEPFVGEDTRRLHIVAEGPLLDLPFAALLTEASTSATPATATRGIAVVEKKDRPIFDTSRDAPWLFRRLETVVLPGLGWAAGYWRVPCGDINLSDVLTVAGPAAPARTIGVTSRGLTSTPVDTSVLAQLPPLPGAIDEAETVVRLLRPERHLMLTVEKGSEGLFIASNPGNFGILAFATHGLTRGMLDGLEWPALVIGLPSKGEDGLLTLPEVLQLDLNAELVMLNASYSFAADRGESWSTLPAVFLLAGARSVFGVYTSPLDEAATRMSRYLTQGLVADAGRDIAGALQRARLSFLEDSGPDHLAHPAIWSSFGLYGNDRGCPAVKE